MENYMHISHQTDGKTNKTNLMMLKTKLASLEASFENNSLSINDHEIENLKNNGTNTKITAWNWSKSFTQQ
ncbi:hypothetical protein CBW53_20740 [Yersinia frederiksenii]|nr:hypothetical protein CBW53_20740 [Yersinia frederiksenii]CNJ14330.1 no significant database hits [Yersinia frederiksenii]